MGSLCEVLGLGPFMSLTLVLSLVRSFQGNHWSVSGDVGCGLGWIGVGVDLSLMVWPRDGRTRKVMVQIREQSDIWCDVASFVGLPLVPLGISLETQRFTR